jgi:hypothetical protein
MLNKLRIALAAGVMAVAAVSAADPASASNDPTIPQLGFRLAGRGRRLLRACVRADAPDRSCARGVGRGRSGNRADHSVAVRRETRRRPSQMT